MIQVYTIEVNDTAMLQLGELIMYLNNIYHWYIGVKTYCLTYLAKCRVYAIKTFAVKSV